MIAKTSAAMLPARLATDGLLAAPVNSATEALSVEEGTQAVGT